jgi:hypothetical protein
MTDPVAAAQITATASLIVALISGGIALWNRRRTDKNIDEVQSMKGAIDRDLERLRAKLSHGQNVSATQWSAEFAAYQAIWRGIVEVRPVADKLVNREGELHQIGFPEEYLDNKARLRLQKDLTEQLLTAAKGLLSAIHDNAPFYPAPIRDAANEAHKATIQLVKKNLGAMTEAMKGNNGVQTQEFDLESRAILLQLIGEVDKVESLIRERLAAVQVVNFTVV